jgi:CHAT domain-containing protein/TolA-binding protein
MKSLMTFGFFFTFLLLRGIIPFEQAELAQKVYEYEHPSYPLADSLFANSQYDRAIEVLDSVASLQMQSEDNEGYLNTLNKLAFFQRRLSRWEESEGTLMKVLTDVKESFGAQHPIAATAYYYLGGLYDRTGRGEFALAYLDSALTIRLDYFGEKSTEVANVFIGIGDTYRFNFSDYENASKNYIKALAIQEASLDPQDLQIGTNYYNIASILRLEGEYDEALIYARQAFNNFIQSPNANSSLKANTYMLIGNILFGQENFSEAIQEYQNAINIGLEDPLVSNNLGSFYNSMGAAYQSMDSTSSAKIYYYRALDALEKRYGKDSNRLSYAMDNLGLIYTQQNMTDSALYYFDRSLALRMPNAGQFKTEIAQVLRFKANVYMLNEHYEKSLAQIQEAIDFLTEKEQSDPYTVTPRNQLIDDIELVKAILIKGISLNNIGEEKTNDEERRRILFISLSELSNADQVLTSLRQSSDRDGTKLMLSDSFKGLYEEALNASYILYQVSNQKEYLDSAYKFISKSKGLSLLETLSGAQAIVTLDLPRDLLEKENKLKSDIAALSLRIARGRASNLPDSVIQKLNEELLGLVREQEAFKEMVSLNYPNYYELKYRYDYPTVQEVQDWVKSKSTVFVEYFYGVNNIYAVGLDGEGISIHVQERDSLIDQHLIDYSSSIVNGYNFSSQKEDFERFTNSAYALYNSLLLPVMDQLASSERRGLMIIPDGYLAAIPFDALLTEAIANKTQVDYRSLPYLHKSKIVSYHFNSSLGMNSDKNNKDRKARNMLAFSYSDEDVANMTAQEILSTNQISGSAEEIEKINSMVSNVKIYTGKDASESNFQLRAPEFDVIHLAIHGEADMDNALESKLIFPSGGDGQDGILHPYELYKLNLNAELVVLSACESGLGKLYNGEGIFSMARAFAFSGAPSIVMSLWKINDRTTSVLMESFYRELTQESPIDLALHTTKDLFLQSADELTAHPSNWAALVPIGNMSGFVWKSGFVFRWWMGLIAAGMFLSALALFLLFKR